MLTQTCPMTTLAVVNVDAVGRPAAPGIHDGRRRTPPWVPIWPDGLVVASGQKRTPGPEPMWVANSTECKIIANNETRVGHVCADIGQRRCRTAAAPPHAHQSHHRHHHPGGPQP